MIPISICVIMKNEEKNIDIFLSSIKRHFSNYPREIILVDTGSTDKTVEIASKHDVSIHNFTWVNDFSAARNYSLSLASNEYVLILDTDEFIEDTDLSFIDTFISNHPLDLGMLSRNNITTHADGVDTYTDDVPRFFNKNIYRYEGIIHEQVISNKDDSFSRVRIPLVVKHAGYCGTIEEMKAKANRNIALLHEISAKEKDPYILYQIGQSYYAIKEYEKACEYFSQALEFDLDTRLDYVRMMVVSYGNSLLECEHLEEALSFESIYDEFADYPEFVLMMGSIYLKAGLLEKAIDEFFKATSFERSNTQGVTTYIPLYNLGCINEVIGNIDDAVSLYKQCGDYKPAKRRLELLKE